jgi:hypothetical protein
LFLFCQKAIDLSSDHKPRTSESERERVQNAGGISLGIGCEKVMGNYVIKEQWALGDFGGSVTISRSIGIVLPGSVFRLLQIIAPKKKHIML